ncbi:MAG TPA: alpha/beta hydrolase [Ramlibacter sp.]|uniref:alpha/beta hydrolase n=1 Tax=Ramlibacter sp. TaxID=1917967 RepID=UPI002BBA142B|nr:alpha/beta hydrolase [Ramlibacter sp.]HVZ45764.1 alpha/beta hydrolase [Ramlibacter sp.]
MAASLHIHPALRELAQQAAGLPSMSQVSPAQARAGIAARTASRPRGPQVANVFELEIAAEAGVIPARVYDPGSAAGVVAAFHGGGWLMGSRESFDATCRHLAIDSGLAVVNIDYRLAPEHPFPAAFDDAWAAVCWIAEHATQFGWPQDRLGVFGESAGANLAAAICLMARNRQAPRILAQALVYPPTDALLTAASLDTYAEGFLQRTADVKYAFATYALDQGVSPTDWRLSPLHAKTHAGLPRTLVITAECDAVRDDGEAYAAKLAEAGVDVACVRYLGMLHTFYGMRGTLEAASVAQRQVADMLRTALVEG